MKEWVCGCCGKIFLAHTKSYNTPRKFCSRACESISKRKLILGVGYNDIKAPVSKVKDAYTKWRGMLERCYDKKSLIKAATYNDCIVCEEWKFFSNFEKWHRENFDINTMQGYHLDKDIIIQGNHIYSPDTCCFVPSRVNALFTRREKCRGKYKIGVRKYYNKFEARCQNNTGEAIYLGTFSTENEAFEAYKIYKLKVIKDVAEEHFTKGLITEKVYKALLKYKIKEY